MPLVSLLIQLFVFSCCAAVPVRYPLIVVDEQEKPIRTTSVLSHASAFFFSKRKGSTKSNLI